MARVSWRAKTNVWRIVASLRTDLARLSSERSEIDHRLKSGWHRGVWEDPAGSVTGTWVPARIRTMTYIKWRDTDGYERGCRECLDLSSFAADLGKALTANRSRPTSATVMPRSSWQTVASSLCRKAGDQPRSTRSRCHIDPSDELDRLRGYDLSIEYRLPASVAVSAKLPLDQIVPDIKPPLITPAQTPLANFREFAKQLERDGRPLEMIGRTYAAQFPELEITVPRAFRPSRQYPRESPNWPARRFLFGWLRLDRTNGADARAV